ncbi:PREDICTED: probable transmembrane GTPase FZO-like, chloroplastic [Ipomoea nil]|uniref:probable transmembrane GTPase FZO-like, chloroplastic n=1 Tax=Ipomoea nil TaxID=35883 RepID=UPI0009014BAD|nr:PREDICTED: probable transmembrane GTPase FZO-like, chloroplastic [Ipomoea nil]
MVSLLSQCCSVHSPSHCHFASPTPSHYSPPHFKPRLRCTNISVRAAARSNVSLVFNNEEQPKQQPRTLFPGGFKRPEIKVPSLVLQLSTQEVFDNRNVLDEIDQAVSGRVGIVLLSGGGVSGGKLYEAACLLKSVIRERAYLLVDERVDIAAAVNASGVLLSDQGLPTIVARNTMLDTKSESVVLPLVARIVQTPAAALQASNSEGADFIIFNVGESRSEEVVSSVFETLKVPVFVMIDSLGEGKLFNEASYFLELGASGLVISTNELKFISNDDGFSKLFFGARALEMKTEEKDRDQVFDSVNGFPGRKGAAGFTKLREIEQQLIKTEKLILRETINAIEQAAPLMEEVSLLIDAVSQLDEPFLLVIVGEFNSGKSTFINALLGERYLKDGVVPSTNEITFLRYSELDSNKPQRCERNPDDQYVCYLPAPILKDMIIVDTPGTNVILQRQQRLTEEFVPRADLLIFVMSADRPLTESEVNFLRYTQQWKKKVVFVLNKCDIYLNMDELEEAVAFIKENTKKLLSTKCVTLYPVSSRCALEAKLSSHSDVVENSNLLKSASFSELEKYLYSFLDASTTTGIERMRLKLETPVRIAEQLLSSCQNLVREECQQAKKDLMSVNEFINGVKDWKKKMESESISWKRQILSLIDNTQARVFQLVDSTLRLSNLDLVAAYIFKGDKTSLMPATLTVRDDIIGPAAVEAEKLLSEYMAWLQSNADSEEIFYRDSFQKRWPSLVDAEKQIQADTSKLLGRKYELSSRVMADFSPMAASKLFEQEIREAFLGTFGGLGVAGLSASLLTSILTTTLEDLLALGLCSAGGLLAVSNFPARRQQVVKKVKRTGDGLAREIEEAMQKDLLETMAYLEDIVKFIGKPYQEAAQNRLDKLLATADNLTDIESKLKTLQNEIQNLHVS